MAIAVAVAHHMYIQNNTRIKCRVCVYKFVLYTFQASTAKWQNIHKGRETERKHNAAKANAKDTSQRKSQSRDEKLVPTDMTCWLMSVSVCVCVCVPFSALLYLNQFFFLYFKSNWKTKLLRLSFDWIAYVFLLPVIIWYFDWMSAERRRNIYTHTLRVYVCAYLCDDVDGTKNINENETSFASPSSNLYTCISI